MKKKPINPVVATNQSTQILNDDVQPEGKSEQAVSGSTPDPESDDDTLQNAQDVGLQLDEDEEHPKELNSAKYIKHTG